MHKHVRRAHKAKPFGCGKCKIRFDKHRGLIAHEKSAHRVKQEEQANNEVSATDTVFASWCSFRDL